MDTTQSEGKAHPGKSRQVAAGAALALGAFLFGGFMALPALISVLPRLRRYWPFALALFLGVLGVRGLTLLGVNPVLAWAQLRALDRLEQSLGGKVSYDAFHGDATLGELYFEGLRVELPELNGELALESVRVNTGLFLLFGDGHSVSGRNLSVRVDASQGRLERYLSRLSAPTGTRAELQIEGGRIEVFGSPTSAAFTLKQLSGGTTEIGWRLNIGLSRAELTLMERTHQLEVYGGLSVGERDNGLFVVADLRAVDEEAGFGILRGELQPGGDSSMTCVIDQLDLNPVWARYRKVDSCAGVLRGRVLIAGDLNQLGFGLDCDVQDFSYYHFTAMALDPAHSFKLPNARLSGTLVLLDGEQWDFQQVTVTAEQATLATGASLNAQGSGKLSLAGIYPELGGSLEATIEGGTIREQISWSPTHPRGLDSVQPNIVTVAEQFQQLDLEWKVEVRQLTVDCEPLTGTLSGSLQGRFQKQPGVRVGTLRAGGELTLNDGRVRCLGLDAPLTAALAFNPNAPTTRASLKGSLTTELGGTPINCELTGDLQRPVFVFTGANLSPQDLGRRIYRYSPAELSRAELLARREQCTRIFGPAAAMEENPFVAKAAGKVAFTVR